MEWETKEYSSSSLEDEESSEKSSKLGWILDTGLSLGKKFVITGFVISSVPLVLPPLVVVSALGFAVSLPFGFVFASYTGAQKLMSTLLPSPAPYETIDYGAEEEEEAIISNKKEEKDQEGIRDGNEIVIESLDSDVGARVHGELGNEDQFTEDTVSKAYDEPNVGEIGGEKHEEGAKEEEKLSSEDQITEDRVMGKVSEAQNVSELQEEKDAKTEELNVKERESEGQNAVQVVTITEPVIEVKSVTIVEDKATMDVGSKKEVQLDSENKNGKMEKNVPVVKETTDKDKKRQTNSKGKSSPMEPDNKKAKKKTSTTAQKASGKKKGDKKHEKAPGPEVVAEERTSGSPSEGIVIGSGNVESSQVLASKKNDEQSVLPGGEKFANETSKGENNHSLEVAALIGLPELKNDGEMENDADHDLHADKERRNRDEEIWKEIDAIRVIVGIQAPLHTSYTEELKALYLFTGIEPPSSVATTDSSDVAEEFYSKLQFLKSVIGVK